MFPCTRDTARGGAVGTQSAHKPRAVHALRSSQDLGDESIAQTNHLPSTRKRWASCTETVMHGAHPKTFYRLPSVKA